MELLAALFAHTEETIELRACPNERGGQARSLFTRDLELAKQFVEGNDRPGWGVFFGVATRMAPRGTIENAAELPCLFADLDKVDKVAALGALTGAYLPPSFVVDSGRGLHAYWLLDEPEDVRAALTNDHPLVGLLQQLKRIFAGDPAVCDLARILRVPGSHNTKGETALPVSVIWSSGRTYSLADVADWVTWQRELLGEPVDPFLAAAARIGVKPALDVEQALAGMSYPDNIHETQLRVSASLRAAGRGEDEIVATLIEATRLAAGQDGSKWNWVKEERSIRSMVRGAEKKFGEVVPLKPKKAPAPSAGGPEPQAAPHNTGGGPARQRVAELAREAWGRPIIKVDGEMWTYAGGIWEPLDGPLLDLFTAYVHRAGRTLNSTGNSDLNGAMRWIREDLDLHRFGVAWDAAGVIVGENGALRVDSGQLVPHAEAHHATRRVGCAIEPGASCPKWIAFLGSSVPADAIATLQEWFGAALVRGKTREMTKGLFCIGPSRSGKTQLADVLRALVGGRACGLSVRAMGERFGMQPLLNSAAWIADDAVGAHETLAAESYKVVVTGESVSIERKNSTSVEVRFDVPVCLTMNHLPVVRDNSDAVYNRTLVLPMNSVCEEGEARPIAREVIAEELAGVLNWAIQGWQRLRARGRYEVPASMVEAVAGFKAGNNPFQEFAELCLVAAPDRMVLRDDVRDAFNTWLEREVQARNGWSGKAISSALKNLMPKAADDKVHKGRVWVGIAFAPLALAYLDQGFGATKRPIEEINMGLPEAVRLRHRPTARTVF